MQAGKRTGAAGSMPTKKKSRLRSTPPAPYSPETLDSAAAALAPAMASPSLPVGETNYLAWDHQISPTFSMAEEPSYWVPDHFVTTVTPSAEYVCASDPAANLSVISHYVNHGAEMSSGYLANDYTNAHDYTLLSYKEEPTVSVEAVFPGFETAHLPTNLDCFFQNDAPYGFPVFQPSPSSNSVPGFEHMPGSLASNYGITYQTEPAPLTGSLEPGDGLHKLEHNRHHDDETHSTWPFGDLTTTAEHLAHDPLSLLPNRLAVTRHDGDRSEPTSANASHGSSKTLPKTKAKPPKTLKKDKRSPEKRAADLVVTNKTRKWKACIRCRTQKIRCIPGPSNDEKDPCQGCLTMEKLTTKKVIHRGPCLRWNISDTILFRAGGLGLTARWKGVGVEDIPANSWGNDDTFTIHLGVSLVPNIMPMELRVRRFVPVHGDKLIRHCGGKEIELPAYALANVKHTIRIYQDYITDNAFNAIDQYAQSAEAGDELIRKTFALALKHFRRMQSTSAMCGKSAVREMRESAAALFQSYFRLWLATRFTLGYAYISRGYEKMEGFKKDHLTEIRHREEDHTVSYTPRMITAQLDSIAYKHVLMSQKKDVLDKLCAIMQRRSSETFFAVYFVVFMILHEVSVSCRDRHRRAKDMDLKQMYDLPDTAEKIKDGAKIILGYWHYFKGDTDPLKMNQSGLIKAMGDDAGEEVTLLMTSCRRYEDMETVNPSRPVDWQTPVDVVSQMFKANWDPKKTD